MFIALFLESIDFPPAPAVKMRCNEQQSNESFERSLSQKSPCSSGQRTNEESFAGMVSQESRSNSAQRHETFGSMVALKSHCSSGQRTKEESFAGMASQESRSNSAQRNESFESTVAQKSHHSSGQRNESFGSTAVQKARSSSIQRNNEEIYGRTASQNSVKETNGDRKLAHRTLFPLDQASE